MALVTLTNGDAVAQSPGQILRLTGSNAYLALADTPTNAVNVFGSRLSLVGAGANGPVVDLWSGIAIPLDAEPSVGDILYLSATAAGNATHIKPTYGYALGLCGRKDNVSGTWYGTLLDSKTLQFNGRVLGTQGTDVASASNITLTQGNQFNITGAIQIDRISSVGWTVGSPVILKFNSAITLSHGTAVSGSFYGLKLAGSIAFNAKADSTLTLYFDGSWWRESARTVS